MLTTGLLLSLDLSSPDVADRLATHPSLTVGERMGRWLPVAAEAADDAGCRALHDWIAAQPGVAFVDVVHVSFDDRTPEMTSPTP